MNRVCSNPDCRVDVTGVCIDAFNPIDTCPNIDIGIDNNTDSVDFFEVDESLPGEDLNDMVEIDSGRSLSIEDSTKILRKFGAKLIACAGASNVGKTTLLASMYECLNKNQLTPYQFGGSKTLFAFEEICHYSRAISKSNKPDTPRTLRTGQVSFYHLAFTDNKNREDFLLADRAGEEYEAILDSSNECDDLFEIERADVFMILVDASILIGSKRHSVKRNIQNMVKILHKKHKIKKGLTIFLIMTRYDLTDIKTNRESINNTFNNIFENITEHLDGFGINVEKQIVAARPDKLDEFENGHGVIELLKKLIKLNVVTDAHEYNQSITNESSRVFHNLQNGS